MATPRNRATTDPEAPDPQLRPLHVDAAAATVAHAVAETITALPRWTLGARDEDCGFVRATRRTRFLRFADDIEVRVTPVPSNAGAAIVNARSKARWGDYDFGQNARNLVELLTALEARLRASGIAVSREVTASGP
jgi:uncharacterized protein (DUF1499 family)